MEKCWLVKCPKGDAVFLRDREQRALDYAAQHGGIIVQMYGQASAYRGVSDGKASVNSGDIRPAGSITIAGGEQLPPDTSSAGEVCEASKPT